MKRARILGAAAAVLFVVAAVVAITVAASEEREQTVAANRGPTTSWVEEETTTTTATTVPPTETTAPATAAPAHTARRAAAPKAAPTSTGSSRSSLGPRPPGSVVVPYSPGRASWSGTANGITISVRMEPAAPRTGEVVRFFLSASSARNCCGLSMVYGDGFSGTASQCGSAPGSAAGELTHTYNKAGRWEFAMTAWDGQCGVDTGYGSLYGWLDVAPGTATSQGPSRPRLMVGDNNLQAGYGDDRSYVTVAGQGEDDDGYVARFVVDWGDGSPTEQLPGDPAGCRPTRSGWPTASRASMPTNPPATHRYAAPGAYQVRVTVYSTGCDGRDEQSAVSGFAWTY